MKPMQRASKSACLVVLVVSNLIEQGKHFKGRPLAQQLKCLTYSESPWVRIPVGPVFFLPFDIWWLSVDSWLRPRASKRHVSLVLPLFRADSMSNLIKQRENVDGRPSGSAAQLEESSHDQREALGSSPDRATIFSSTVTTVSNREIPTKRFVPLGPFLRGLLTRGH